MRDWRVLALILAYIALAVLANTGFKLSADSSPCKRFLLWQIVGNLSGFLSVLSLTALFRLIPMHVAFPVTQALAVVAVQVLAARLLFRETIAPLQWAGTALLIAGIARVTARK